MVGTRPVQRGPGVASRNRTIVHLPLRPRALDARAPRARGDRPGGQWPDSDSYEGELREGAHHGRGVCRWADGSAHDGTWREGEPHGYGVLTLAGSRRLEGEWAAGRFAGDDAGREAARLRARRGFPSRVHERGPEPDRGVRLGRSREGRARPPEGHSGRIPGPARTGFLLQGQGRPWGLVGPLTRRAPRCDSAGQADGVAPGRGRRPGD